MKKRWIGMLLVAVMGGLMGGCETNGQGNGEPIGVPSDFAGKSPALPTTFVDTSGQLYAWHKAYNRVQSIGSRIPAPEGYVRRSVAKGSFAWWLRGVPLKPGRPDVLLYDDTPKGYQGAHHAVIDMDVPPQDLQQCADAVMRLRAEYLFTQGSPSQLHFNFTSGDVCSWEKWTQGIRPKFYKQGNQWKVAWKETGQPGNDHEELMAYLKVVYTWAGTASLEKELVRVDPAEIQAGDVFIQGGFPGHAILVMDVAESQEGKGTAILLAQSYMPAQDMHVLRNPGSADRSPWYVVGMGDELNTPEWTFEWEDLRRFVEK